MAKWERIIMVLFKRKMRIHLVKSKTLLSFSRCSQKNLSLLLPHCVFLLYPKDNGIFLRIPSTAAFMIFITIYKWKHILFRIHFHFSFHNNGNAFIRCCFFFVLFSHPFVLVRNIVDAVSFKINDAMINESKHILYSHLFFVLGAFSLKIPSLNSCQTGSLCRA